MLPKFDLGEDGLTGNNGVGVDEDDRMGGRLGPGGEGYPIQQAPVGGTAVGGRQHQNQPQMSNISVAADGVGASSSAGYPNEKRAKRQQYLQPHTTSNPSISSGSIYSSSSYSSLRLNPNTSSVSPVPYSVTSDHDGSPSLGGRGSGGSYSLPVDI